MDETVPMSPPVMGKDMKRTVHTSEAVVDEKGKPVGKPLEAEKVETFAATIPAEWDEVVITDNPVTGDVTVEVAQGEHRVSFGLTRAEFERWDTDHKDFYVSRIRDVIAKQVESHKE